MTSTVEQRLYVEKTIQETMSFFDCDVSYSIEWSKRFKRRAADATYFSTKNHGRLRFSEFVWPYMNRQEQWNTIVHEVCHIVDSQYYARFKAKGHIIAHTAHGKTWKNLMTQAGADPSACWRPDLDTHTKMLKEKNSHCIKVACDCRIHMVTKNRATRMRNGKRYVCKRCNTFVKILSI